MKLFLMLLKKEKMNGKFQSINDFLNRVNPKDMNKLQLEGLVKAGAFDSINTNRQSLFDSIPNFITKTKNIFENRSTNQIDLFSEDENLENNIINEIDDWKFEERLSKEFEAVRFLYFRSPFKSIYRNF